MSDLRDLSARFCPDCGAPVATAQATTAESAFAEEAQGSFEAAGKHVVIDGAQVSVFIHQEGDSA